jgi:hypothetical protein
MSICVERALLACCGLVGRALSRQRRPSLCCLVWLLAGCFEVHEVAVDPDVPALDIDDFEDGDNQPSSSRFADWRCETFPGPSRASCVPVAPGFASAMAEAVRFEIEDPVNARIDYANLALEAPVRLGTLDLGSYESLSFGAKLEPGAESGFVATLSADAEAAGSDAAAPDASSLIIQVACNAVGDPGALPYGFWIQGQVALGPEWSSFDVALTELIRPSWVADFSWRDCIANVDSLLFVVGPTLSDGETFAGTLSIDELSFR